jgi:PKD repeat protein
MHPIHQYGTPGEYYANLSTTDYEGNTSQSVWVLISVMVDEFPNANFTWNATIFYIDRDIQFIDNTTGGNLPLTYQWNFGDNTPNSSLQNPIHTYSSMGFYNVTLTVTDLNGDVSVYTRTVFVNRLTEDHSMLILFSCLTAFSLLFEIIALKNKWHKWVKLTGGLAVIGSGIATVVTILI